MTPTDYLPSAMSQLRRLTPARIGLSRAGHALTTQDSLALEAAQAQARDAVHGALDPDALARALGETSLTVLQSRAADRATYLQRPDLGGELSENSPALPHSPGTIAIILADGLSAAAVQRHGPPMTLALRQALADWQIAPITVALQARVAIGDDIGARMGADMVIILIGERPGLSAFDSLGAYLTWQPRWGKLNSERNCVSNIRSPHGLPYTEAATRIASLADQARRLRLTGVGLKDQVEGSNTSLPSLIAGI